MILNLLAVFIGGAIGATIRYIAGIVCSKYLSVSLPVATFSVNFISSFILGFVFAYFMARAHLNPAWRLAITVGFCGSLSTLSTFSYEILLMLKDGEYITSFLYILFTLAICILAVALGMKLGKMI